MIDKLAGESEYFVAWLLFWLSSTVGGVVLGAIVGGIAGRILGAAVVDLQSIKLICGGIGFLLSIPVSYGLLRLFVHLMIVRKVESRVASMTVQLPNQQVGATSQ